MGYKWKPSATQRKAFAEKMNNDPEYAAAYNERKEAKAEKRRAGSKFDYETAGGTYIPTKEQYEFAMNNYRLEGLTPEQHQAFNQVTYGYSCQEKIHHDYIHIVNELRRKF